MEAGVSPSPESGKRFAAPNVDVWGMLDSLPLQFALTSRDGRLAYANRAWLSAHGLTPVEAVGKYEHDLRPPRLGHACPGDAPLIENRSAAATEWPQTRNGHIVDDWFPSA